MTDAAWTYAYASVSGTSHVRSGTPCQDAVACDVLFGDDSEPILVVVVSDGAGSASASELGSRVACSFFLEGIQGIVTNGGTVRDVSSEWFRAWLVRLQARVENESNSLGVSTRELACTMVAAVIGTDCAAFGQIGDGAIVVAEHGGEAEYQLAFWPAKGEYANVTEFVTEPRALETFRYSLEHRTYNQVAVFTDGLERLALDFQHHAAHPPFFGAMFRPLVVADEGYQSELSTSLAKLLDSKRVNDRTDDDKTIAIASRCTGQLQGDTDGASAE